MPLPDIEITLKLRVTDFVLEEELKGVPLSTYLDQWIEEEGWYDLLGDWEILEVKPTLGSTQ